MPSYTKIIIAIIIAAGAAYVGYSLFFGPGYTRYDFRATKWGMSPDQVRESENPELESGASGNFIFYQDKVAGYDAFISYMFDSQSTKEGSSLILISAYYDFSAGG